MMRLQRIVRLGGAVDDDMANLIVVRASVLGKNVALFVHKAAVGCRQSHQPDEH